MENKNIPNETIIEYHKRFANGEQYLEINFNGEIVETDRAYYWQEKGVYNHLSLIVDKYKDLGEEFIYGKNGLVSHLIPLQRAYNAIRNRELEYINRISMGVLCVEDGSVDVDELKEDGIQGGKVIVYRQGANAPTFVASELNTKPYIDSATNIRKEMYDMAQQFVQTRIEDVNVVEMRTHNKKWGE
ncbi:MAG: hypothetical protein NC131_18470 [Roseburia sp.]|nr:hypothetical protein [Roseburia sp.]